MTVSDTHRAIDAVWRIESARIVAGLAPIVRDVGLAEELEQDALVAAIEKWPESGVPDNPGAWLMAAAKHRSVDLSLRLQRRPFCRAQRIIYKYIKSGCLETFSSGLWRCTHCRWTLHCSLIAARAGATILSIFPKEHGLIQYTDMRGPVLAKTLYNT